jgi:hypothetical protein
MDKEKRKKILIITTIVVLILALLLWVLRTSDQSPNGNDNVNEGVPIFTPPSAQIKNEVPEIPKDNPIEFSVINLAKTYTARFGSWSTDNRGNNLKELIPLSTTKMQTYLSSIDVDFEVEEFNGVTTKSLSAKILDIDDDSASVLVSTQKIETNGDLEKNVYYQEAELSLLNLNGEWLVDEFDWKK